MKKTQDRVLYIDQLKGIAILLVVLGHFIQYNTVEGNRNILFGIIYSFHMPLFMFISGYVAYLTIKPAILDQYFIFLKKKIITILIPFFTWPLLIKPYFFNNFYDNNPLKTIEILIKGPSGGLWFLWYLFLLYLLYTLFLALSIKLNKSYSVIIDIILCALVCIIPITIGALHLITYVDSFLLYYTFFFLGVFVSKYDRIKRIILTNTVFSLCLIVFMMGSRLYDFNSHTHLNLAVKMVLSISAINSIYYIVQKIKWNGFIDKYIREWGKNSLVIYVTQFGLLSILPQSMLIPPLNILLLGFITIIFSITTVIVCMAILRIIELSNILNFLLYGRLTNRVKSLVALGEENYTNAIESTTRPI